MSAARGSGFVPWPDEFVHRYRELGLWTGQTLGQMLADSAAHWPERVAAVDRRGRSTYRQLDAAASESAKAWRALGVKSGDSVLLQMPNRISTIEALFGLFRVGARPVMAQPAHRLFELRHFATKTNAVAHLIAGDFGRFDYAVLSSELRAACPWVRHTVVDRPAESTDWLAADQSLETDPDIDEPVASDIALFQLSGGSTALPKLIARTHDDYLYSVRRSVEVCELSPETTYLVVLPLLHNYPLSSPGILGVLLAGGKIVFSETPDPSTSFDWIERERVTMTGVVPSLLTSWLSAAKRAHSKVESLKLIQVGGARLHESVAERIPSELGCRLQQVYGMAEGLVCYTRSHDSADVIRTCQGRPMSEYDEVRIVGEDGEEVVEGEIGDLLVRGPYTIRGYYDAPDHNERAFTSDGFYKTGDRVRRTAEGNIAVAGRSKEQINRGGEKIAAPEIEALLMRHAEVAEVALVPIRDPYLGERSVAFVVARNTLDAKALKAHLRSFGIAEFKVPDEIRFVEAMPKTAIGKIDKRALSMLAEEIRA